MELIINQVKYPRDYLTFSYGDVFTDIYKYNGDYWVVEYYNYDDWDEETNPEGGFVYVTMIINLRTLAQVDLYYEDLEVEDIEKVISESNNWYIPEVGEDWKKDIKEFYLTYIKEHYENK